MGRPSTESWGAVSERFRRIADRLAGLPLDDRQGAWNIFLDGQADADEIDHAIDRANPFGDAPDPEAGADDGGDGWPPLRLAEMPPAEPFPVEVLPDTVARMVRETAEAIGCAPDFAAVNVLAVAAGAIGRSVSLRLKSNYFASPGLYIGGIGPPSDGKSPSLAIVTDAVRRLDRTLEDEHNQALAEWQETVDALDKKTKPPAPPAPRRIDLDDTTIEAAIPILADNPRGLILINDELTALVAGCNQYKSGKGNDRQALLKIWAGQAIKKDRVLNAGRIPIRVAHPCLTIMGGLTPDTLPDLADPRGRADGFLDRFLFAFPEPRPIPPWTEQGVPQETADEWAALVARLWLRPMSRTDDGRGCPQVAHFTDDGRRRWRALYDAHAAEMNTADFPPELRGAWGKLREYAGRLALILACVDHAADPTADPLAMPSIGPRIVDNAWRLVGYFGGHARRVHAAIGRGRNLGGGHVVQAIVSWLRDGDRRTFAERDIKQARRWIVDADLADALDWLAERHAIRRHEASDDTPRRGRPASPMYDVNPALLDTQNPRFTQNSAPEGDSEYSENFEYRVGGES